MAALPDPGRSRAVLIGASTYSHLEDLPAVRNNLPGFRDILVAPELGGLPADNCTIVAEPVEPRDLYRTLRQHAAAAEDTLLVYFAGHGRLGRRNELWLCLPDTDPDELWFTALGYEQLREAVAESPATKKVVILDCCFSGRALADQAGDEETILGQVGIEGTYLLTATPRNAVALAPPGEPYTAFTGTLLGLLNQGIPGGPELLTFGQIYPRLKYALTSRQLPRPCQQGSDTITHLALTRNLAYTERGGTEDFNERFAEITDLLSHEMSAPRLVGVRAMADLADAWPENRQTCVDALCEYLRRWYAPDPGPEAPEWERGPFEAIREIRHTVIQVITAHLKDDAAVSWQGLNFDFTGAVFDGGDFTRVRFSGGEVTFAGAEFPHGAVSFDGAEFSGAAVSFSYAEFSGATVSFVGARFSSGAVGFVGARFSSGAVDFTAAGFSGGEIGFDGAVFSGAAVSFDGAEFSGATVSFGTLSLAGLPDTTVNFIRARFPDRVDCFDCVRAEFSGGVVGFGGAVFSGGQVGFGGAVFSGGQVGFDRARFDGGQVDFDKAVFSGGTVTFAIAKFSRGDVDFFNAKFSGATVSFGSAEFSGATVSFVGGGYGCVDFSGGTVGFGGAVFSGGEVGFGGAVFSGGTVSFGGAEFSGATVSFSYGGGFGGAVFSGGQVSFGHARFSGGTVDFGPARFSGATVSFDGAVFSGGQVDFARAQQWSHPPMFSRDGRPPAGVALPVQPFEEPRSQV